MTAPPSVADVVDRLLAELVGALVSALAGDHAAARALYAEGALAVRIRGVREQLMGLEAGRKK